MSTDLNKDDDDQHLGCCDFRVVAYGSSRTTLTALRDKVDLDLSVNTTAAADTSAIGPAPPQPAATSADMDSDNKVAARLLQGADRIGKVDEYTVTWDVINSRLPAIVEIQLSGKVKAHMRCAKATGSATFADFGVREQDDRAKGQTTVVVTARNACNESDRCEFRIREP